ncbi:MAG TPA: hypothetical protein VLE96_06210 [Chlamydiales bacterium]|nr:hypothetical protein [Chlamydiales bacterium]
MRLLIALCCFSLSAMSYEYQVIDLRKSPNSPEKLANDAFNSAPEFGPFFENLKNMHHIDTAFETGTYLGKTTGYLSKIFNHVYTVEISELPYDHSRKFLSQFSNVHCYLGSSNIVLREILPSLKDKPIFFYLDAHGYEYCPLLAELEEISKTHRDNCILVIDDFKVPGRPDISYDAFYDYEFSFEYIHETLDKVFSNYICYYVIPKNLGSRAKFVAIPKK